MVTNLRSGFPFRPSFSLVMLFLVLSVLWAAGGASREDVFGQAVVRAASAVLLVAAILFGDQTSFARMRPVLFFLLAAAALALLQLIPLPPAIWQALPGRSFFAEAAEASGISQPWRPLSLVPGATANAAASLIVPVAMLVFMAGLSSKERVWLPGLILAFVAMAMFVGLLQFSGAAIDNPFINDIPGQVSGSFANRNHLALFLALGCLLAPVWAFLDGRRPGWRAPVALGLVLLFALTILASGSRTGLLLGGLGIVLGLVMIQRGIRQALGRYPRWVFPALIGGLGAAIAISVLVSIAAGRAVSIDRALALDVSQDMRARALPTVVEMVRLFFPFGSGLGGFDPVFRIHEPFGFLAPTYHVHAHNDFLEIALDAGLPGILLLAAAIAWWAWASVRAWRAGSSPRYAIPKLGSAMLLLVFIASIFDFPARTPMIMAMIVVAGVWLCSPVEARGGSALPKSGEPL